MTDGSGPSVPLLYRLVSDRSGQSETLGVVLLLGIAIVGSAAIVAFGSTALNETKQASQLQRTEHTMTLFDSRAAMVALGESPQQTIDISSSGDGSYKVKEGTGQIRIVHRNYTGGGDDELLYKNTLGEVVYTNGGTKIAYQGGGVWRKEGNQTSMVSPPEFHYRDSTLTLPVIRVLGNGSASGQGSVTIDSVQDAKRVYPNDTDINPAGDEVGSHYNTTAAGGTRPYTNPVENGSVWVYVQSDYYKGWAEFFRSRSDGKVKVWDSNNTAAMELVGGGKVGDFSMPANGNSLDVSGVADGHTINNFTVILTDDAGDSANFDNLQWSMYAEEGSLQWEVHLRDGKKACKGAGGTEYADVYVYFSNDSGATYQGWGADDAVPITCEDFDGDGDDENVLRLNLTSETIDMEYMDLDSSNANHFDPQTSTLLDPVGWDQHQSSVAWEPISFDTGDLTTINNTTNHYLPQFSNTFQITIDDKSSDTVNEDQSRGTLSYSGSGKIYITYLHITENEIRVEF